MLWGLGLMYKKEEPKYILTKEGNLEITLKKL